MIDRVRQNLRCRRDMLEKDIELLRAELTPVVARHRALKTCVQPYAKSERRALGKEILAINETLAERRRELTSVLRGLSKANGNSIDRLVSEHAMLRYLERIRGLDMTRLEHEICDFFRHDGSEEFAILEADGHQALVREGRLVTILPEGAEFGPAATDPRDRRGAAVAANLQKP